MQFNGTPASQSETSIFCACLTLTRGLAVGMIIGYYYHIAQPWFCHRLQRLTGFLPAPVAFIYRRVVCFFLRRVAHTEV